MKLEIWSDYACPYCYIGKKFLEAALAEFEDRDSVNVVFRAFELDPSSGPSVTTTTLERIMRKYGKTQAAAQDMIDHITAMGVRSGINMRYGSVQYTNTFDAHRLTKFAERNGIGAAMTERLFKAYFTDNLPLADHAILAEIGQEVGLPHVETTAMLNSDQFGNEVRADEANASSAGVHGVPFFVFKGAYGFSGAQPKAQLLAALRQFSNPIKNAAESITQDNHMCDDDSCAIPPATL